MRWQFERVNRHYFPGDPALVTLFSNLLKEQREPGVYSEVISRSYFHQIIVSVLRSYDEPVSRSLSSKIAKSKKHIEPNFRPPVFVLARLSNPTIRKLMAEEQNETAQAVMQQFDRFR